ncbi:MAG: hypothetical protein AABZ65_01320 [Candidatus Omnitrophota bacterium]
MKRIPVCLIAFIFIFPVCVVMAEGYKDSRENAPEGMKKIRQGNVTVLVPEGQKITKSGSVTTMESFRQYTVKRFLAAEARAAKLEEAQKKSAEEIKQLKQLVVDLRKAVTELKQKLSAGQEGSPERTGGRK